MSQIRKTINRLFNQKVIVKYLPSGKITTIDYDRLQSIGNTINSRYKSIHTPKREFGYGYGGYQNDIDKLDAERNRVYMEYDQMDSDAILSAALDIYADECTVKNEHGHVLAIHSDNDAVKRLLHNLYYDIINIEFNLWHWIRSLCKYGDFFLYLNTRSSLGIVDVVPIHPSLLKRDDFTGDNENETVYRYSGKSSYSSYMKDEDEFKYHEIAHFRVLTDTNFIPYGKSLLEGARKIWKQLTMMEDAMLIHRIMRAPERRVFKIDVGNLPAESIDGYIEEIANSMKKIPYMDTETGDYNLRFNLMNMLEDFYLPTRGGDSGTEIETLQGLGNEGSLNDIEYLQKKQMANLKIPSAYLGYDEGVDGKGTLAAEDIKFARFIERIQKIVVSELEKIGHIHLRMQGLSAAEVSEFSLSLTTPSIIYERQKVDLLNEKMGLIEKMRELKFFSKKWIYEQIFNMTPEEWEEQQELILGDIKRDFREKQIAEEGNDPAISGKSYGTPHDIVSMQLASNLTKQDPVDIKSLYKKDGRENNPGRPKKYGSFERDRDPIYGRDPSGRKEFETKLQASYDLQKVVNSINNKVVNLREENQEATLDILDENQLVQDD